MPDPDRPRLGSKAKHNLKACEELLSSGLLDPAMSRLYYALFQAGVHAHSTAGRGAKDVESGAVEWSHTLLGFNTKLMRNRQDDRKLFSDARSLREQADYEEIPVERLQVDELLPKVKAFVSEVCR